VGAARESRASRGSTASVLASDSPARRGSYHVRVSSWIRLKWDEWHLEDRWTAEARHASQARAACGEYISEAYANFERSEQRPPLHQRCSDCQQVAQSHGEGST
jgi:hypothetical protein